MSKNLSFELYKEGGTTHLYIRAGLRNVGAIPITGPIESVLTDIDRIVMRETGLRYTRGNTPRYGAQGVSAVINYGGVSYSASRTDDIPRRAEIQSYTDAIAKMIMAVPNAKKTERHEKETRYQVVDLGGDPSIVEIRAAPTPNLDERVQARIQEDYFAMARSIGNGYVPQVGDLRIRIGHYRDHKGWHHKKIIVAAKMPNSKGHIPYAAKSRPNGQESRDLLREMVEAAIDGR